MTLAVFYHAYVGGRWQIPVAEHARALEHAGFTGTVRIGAVGPREDRRRVVECFPHARLVAEADSGFEALTINALRGYALEHDGAVLYAHTKGAATVEAFRDRWRRSMTDRVIGRLWENVALLDEVDAVGCHWLTEQQFPGMFGPTLPPFFGGNFWVARCDYLRTLPECPAEPRYEAERWIGLGNPRVRDLLPGWPHDNRWPELL